MAKGRTWAGDLGLHDVLHEPENCNSALPIIISTAAYGSIETRGIPSYRLLPSQDTSWWERVNCNPLAR